MKQLLLVLLTSACFLQLSAQPKEGTISYERKINLWKRIQDPSRRANIPEFKITKHTLQFNDTASVYKTIKEDEDEQPNPFGGGEGGFGGGGGGRGGFGGGRMSRMMGGNDGDLYKNFNDGLAIQAIEQSGKNFIVVDTIKKQPWKITGETKIILGYPCRKATMKQKGGGFGGNRNRPQDNATPGATASPDTVRRTPREVEVVAWFAETINSPAGPDNFGQLPGVILELDMDNGLMVYTATDIKKTVVAKDIKEPKKGKRMSREEYRKMMMEVMQRFGNNMPPPPAN